jgi:hypothetical protein
MKRQKFWAMTSLAVPLTSATIVFNLHTPVKKLAPLRLNNYMKQTLKASKLLKNPFITTCYPLSPKADVNTALRKIQHKLFMYGVISVTEQAYLDKHFGKVDQKELAN